MSKDTEKLNRILWIIWIPCLLALIYVLNAYKTGSLSKDIYTFYGILALTPIFLSLFIYSLLTGRTKIIGRKIIEKGQMPSLYFFITCIWGLITIIAVIYLLINI